MGKSQRCHKQDYDAVHAKVQFRNHVSRSSFINLHSTRPKIKMHTKAPLRHIQSFSGQHTAVPHCPFQPNSFIISKRGIENTVTIDRVVHAPAILRNAPTDRTLLACSPNDENKDERMPRECFNGNAFDQKYAVNSTYNIWEMEIKRSTLYDDTVIP